MYNKIRIPDSDQDYHCFLLPEKDGSVSVYRMTKVIFGINCSLFVAKRATWKAAKDAGIHFSKAVSRQNSWCCRVKIEFCRLPGSSVSEEVAKDFKGVDEIK